MTDLVASVTKAPSAFWGVIKTYWIFFILALGALLVVSMAKKDAIVGWFTTSGSATKGDKLPAFLRGWLGLTALAVMFGALFYSGDALAAVGTAAAAGATCCAERAPGIFGFLAGHWHYVAAALGSVALGLTQFQAPDVIDCVETHGGASLAVGALSATTAQTMYAQTATHSTTKSGHPLVATDLTIQVNCNVNTTTGNANLDDQDLAALVSYVELISPIMGALTDQQSCTGPILDMVTRFIGDAFERSGDAPVISIVATTSTPVAITKYFTRPFALRFLDRPLTTAPWLGLLHNAAINVGLAADSCLAGVSTGATVDTRVLRASISYLPVPEWYYPMVAYDRVDNPASGSNGLTFKNFGGPGPKCTVPVDYVHTVGQLSSLKGLGGNLTFDTLTKILAPRFGLDNVSNISHLIKARIRAQYFGHIGGVDYSAGGNHVVGTTNHVNMALDKLLFFMFKQPSLDMQVRNMMQMTGTSELPLQYETSSTRTGADKFYVGSVRKVSSSVVKDWQALPGSKLPSTIGEVKTHSKAA